MSYLTGATNAQSLNGILTITDGIITISEGTISGLEEIDLNDLQVADTATIENLVVNNQIDMTSGKITNLANGTNANDAVNKSQLDLKADTTYVDTNFLNKTTTTLQSIAAKLSLTNATTDIFTNPIIQFINTNITPLNQGQFIRFLKSVSQQPNLEIGGLSFCSNNFSNTMRRQADLICSMNSNTYPEINLKFNDGAINPLTINYGQFISRNNKQYFQKQDGTNIFNYIDTFDYVAFSKDISLGSNNIINVNNLTINNQIDMTSGKITNLADPTLAQDASTKYYTDNHSNNGNYLLRNGTLPMTGNLQMGSYKITNLLDPFDLNDGANKYYVDTQTANTHYLLRNGSLAMTGNLNLATHNLTTTGDINCNDITSDGNINTTADMSCADFNSAGNQIIGSDSLGVLDVKNSAFFEANVLIETNKNLAFNSGDLSTTNGMRMNYDGGVGFFDVRGSEFRIRTASAGTPSDIRFKVNDTNTSVINNFFVNGNTTLGNNVANDTTTFNSIANFPSGSELKFNSGSTLLFQSGATTTFASGSNTNIEGGANLQFKSNSSSYYLTGAYLEYANVQTFATGSYIDSARVRIIPSGNSNFQLDNTNVENGVYCDNTNPITITMPGKNAYWNNRHYFIKVLGQDVDIDPPAGVTIDNSTSTINIGGGYRSFQFAFTSDFQFTGKIFIIGDK
jgi:hypothetical protein